jgi:hypothetical protein
MGLKRVWLKNILDKVDMCKSSWYSLSLSLMNFGVHILSNFIQIKAKHVLQEQVLKLYLEFYAKCS